MLHPAGCTSHHVTVALQEDVGLKDLPRAFQLQINVRRTLEE